MEVAPPYLQNPETLKEVYVSTSGGTASGSQTTNAVAGTVVSPSEKFSINSVAANAVRNLATNSIGATGKGASSTGTAVSTSSETMIPLSSVAHFAQGETPLVVNHQDLLVSSTVSFNLPPGVLAQYRGHGHRGDHEQDRECRRAFMASLAEPPRSFANRWRASPFSLSRRWRPSTFRSGCSTRASFIRSPSSPPFLGRCRRGAGADAVSHRIRHHRDDRRDLVGRHREEERDHDDRSSHSRLSVSADCRRPTLSSRPV